MRSRRRSTILDMFGPGTDLAISLFATMAVGFVWMSGLRTTLAGELDLSRGRETVNATQLQAAIERSERLETELASLRAQRDQGSTASARLAALEVELAEAQARELELKQVQAQAASMAAERDSAIAREVAARRALDELRSTTGPLERQRQLEAELEKSRQDLRAMEVRVSAASADRDRAVADSQRRLLELQDRILKPLGDVLLTIRVSGKIPAGTDLELFVQDPQDRIVYFDHPRLVEGHAEVVRMVLSEDFQRVSGKDEEVLFAVRTSHVVGKPYLVGCLVRERGAWKPRPIPEGVPIEWSVTLAPEGAAPQRLAGSASIPSTSTVYYQEGATLPAFTLLPFVASFEVVDGKLSDVALPKFLRGYGPASADSTGAEVHKMRDK